MGEKEMTVTIYAMTHKKFEQPRNPIYVPLQVGHACREDLGYLPDDTGDNISKLNCYYAELTGVYWLWKNEHISDYIGVCHYRRYLLNNRGKMFSAPEIEELLSGPYDIMTTKKVILDHSYYEGFSGRHNIEDLIQTEKVIAEFYPEYLSHYQKLVHQNKTYFGNMLITDKATYDKYAQWLFGIFFELQKIIDPSQYDDYRMRVYGFISEFLLYVWVTYHNLKVLECDVAVIGEKKETQELKEQLSVYFEKGDIQGAKSYFLTVYNKRPDVLMEASDFDGTLKIAMQAISTAEHERQEYGQSLCETLCNFDEIITYYKKLNTVIQHIKQQQVTADDKNALHNMRPSPLAIEIAVAVLTSEEFRESLYKKVNQLLMSE